MNLLKSIILLLVFISANSLACEKFRIPIEVINRYQTESNFDRGTRYLILAPLEFEGWRLSSGTYRNGNNQIPMSFHLDPEHEGKGIIFLTLDKHFIKDSKVLISYKPIEKNDENGTKSLALCLHVEEVSFGI